MPMQLTVHGWRRVPSPPHPRRVILRPALSAEEARKQFQHQRLTASNYDRLVETNEHGVTDDGSTKYLFLRNTLSSRVVSNTLEVLRTLNYAESNHTRLSLGKSGRGGGTTLGWMDKGGRRRLKPSCEYPMLEQWFLTPLLLEMSGRLRRHLPEEWEAQRELARANGWRVFGGNPHPDMPALLPTHPIFSTVTLNRNVPFRSHADGGNESMACLTTFGKFSGSYLCLPRLRVAFNVRPGDLLIADTNQEQHGSISPRIGTRYSVVAYLRSMANQPEKVLYGKASMASEPQ